RGGDIGLPHEAFPYQESRNTYLLEAREIGRRVEPAFSHDDTIAWDLGCQLLTHGERRFKRPQVAIVDDDQDAVGPKRPRFNDLIGLVDKILSQGRQLSGVPGHAQELGPALERRGV